MTQVWPLGQEDALKEDMATHLSIFAWRIPWIEEPGRLVHKVETSLGVTEGLNTAHHWYY